MVKHGARAPSQRQLRVGEELRHALARILAEGHLRDPDLVEANLTVTEVRVSPDLSNATAFVTPLGGRELETAVAALNRASGFLRSRLAEAVRLRVAPRLSFEADRSFEHAARIGERLAAERVRRDLESAPESQEADDDGAA